MTAQSRRRDDLAMLKYGLSGIGGWHDVNRFGCARGRIDGTINQLRRLDAKPRGVSEARAQ
jgi:hypothetical protein